ncbi:hypothetical protein [Craterilacuibacter sp.]|uniref:hypothetical protein n=1 Tax=Craterilacuibacter sp. TaxID=2870909 RepID=UPI003F2FD17D
MRARELYKCRTLILCDAAATLVAAACLKDAGAHVLALPPMRRLIISYTLPDTTLSALLQQLDAHHIRLDPGSLQHWHLKLLVFSEEVQLSNLSMPVPDTKGTQAFSQLYQQHPHGDCDDTPEELRHER